MQIFWLVFFSSERKILSGPTLPLSLDTFFFYLLDIIFLFLLLTLETQLYSETRNSEVEETYYITSHPTCSAASRLSLPQKHQTRRVRPAFPSAHPSPSVAAVPSFLGGSAPLWEKSRAQLGKTQIALSAATKSKAVQLSHLIKLFLASPPPLLFWFLSFTPIY